MQSPPPRNRPVRSQRGTAYVVAVGIGLMVAAIALGGIAVARSRSESNKLRRSEIQARLVARSAIELARALIGSDSSWRTNRTNGAWVSGLPFEDGDFYVSVSNPSGALNRSELDSVIVLGDAAVGSARQRLSVQFDAKKVPLNCLAIPLTVGGAVTASASTINPTGSTIASNLSVTSTLANIRPNVEACVAIIGTGFSGTTTTGVAARSLPSTKVFDSYVAAGTQIPISSVPLVSSKRTIQEVVLSPASNPYGTADPNGIYIIDCQGQSLWITNCRIVGTLVLKNPGLLTTLTGSVCWAPAIPNYPCLMVDGSISLQMASSALSESSLDTNFNPPGTPFAFPAGSFDIDESDSYASSINGLVYVSGNVTTSNSPTVAVLVIKGTLTVGGTLTLSYNSTPYNSPPPGFYTISMTPSQGSWKRIVDDLPQAAMIQTK